MAVAKGHQSRPSNLARLAASVRVLAASLRKIRLPCDFTV
jgi:hypothetical protein